MSRFTRVTVGFVTGLLLVRERQRRSAAERLAAALLETLLRAIDANDAETGGHVRRVAWYALILADAAGLDTRARRNVERVALFHDIGKIHEALFDIVHDATHLTPEDRRAVTSHPRRGAEVLAPLTAFYPELPAGVLSHHERWDGTGYPRKLRGEDIPLAARIVAIADSFDAMTFGRRYRSAQSATDAIEKLTTGRGTQYDPDLLDLFLSPPVFGEVMSVLHQGRQPRPRRTPPRPIAEKLPPEVSFRWRTTTPAPRAPDQEPRKSP